MTIRYAISIVSALHFGFRWSLRLPACFFASPSRIIYEMVKLGYDGVQAIPIWGLRICKALAAKILLSQGPWNAVKSPWQALRHQDGSLGVRSELKDWIVSPPPDECLKIVGEMNRAGIRRVYHDLWEGPLVEVHPGLDKTVPEIVDICRQTGLRLVLDLHHLRREYRSDELEDERFREYRKAHFPSPLWKEGTMEKWQSAILALAPFVDVIHVQPTEGAKKFTADPFGSETGQLLLYALGQIAKIDPKRELVLVAEYNPGIKCLLLPWLSRKLAKQMLKAMRSIATQWEASL